MNLISEEKINEIRDKADIVDVISSYITLTSKGKNYFGVCPFHDDHSPSMSVSREKQMFKCFTCGAGGNVFTFVSKYENISFIEAVKKIADSEGITLDISKINSKDSVYKHEYEIMNFATKVFQNNLNTSLGKKAKDYLNNRNINDSIINTFMIGYAENNNKALYNILSKKYKDKDLDDLGLITLNGINSYDKFINRIMIPITDLNNQVVGYTGRIIDKSDQAKYINTKETKIYKKGNILFNYYNAKEFIKNKKSVVIVEGNMDAIRLYASGIKNVIALMGTVLTKEQVTIIKNLRVPVILMLDNDEAGETATMNVGDLLNSNNIDVMVVRLSDVKDPDEYIIKNGVDKLSDLINHAVNFVDYKLNKLKDNKNLNNTEELVQYVNKVLKFLENKDNLTKEITIKKLSEEYNIDYDVLKAELKINDAPKNIEIVKNTNEKKDHYKECANKIFAYMMSDLKYITIFNNKLGYFKEKDERQLFNEIVFYGKKHKNINIADFVSYIENFENLKPLVDEIIKYADFDNISENIFMEYISYISNYFKNEEVKELKRKIKLETDINKKVELIEELAIIKKEE